MVAGDAGQVVELHHDEQAGQRHRDACPRRRDPPQGWHPIKARGRRGMRRRRGESDHAGCPRGCDALSGPWKVRRKKRKGGGRLAEVRVSERERDQGVLPPLCSTTASIRARRSHRRPYSSKTWPQSPPTVLSISFCFLMTGKIRSMTRRFFDKRG